MDYNELKDIAKKRGYSLDEFCAAINVTRQGLKKMMDTGSMSLKTARTICDLLQISPMSFFDGLPLYINIGGHMQAGDNNRMEVASRDREIELLREQLRDKEEIINLLKSNK